MGRSQDQRNVKREIVSANVEVVSEENFARRLHGINACMDCQKGRYYGSSRNRQTSLKHHNSNSKHGRRNKQSRRKQSKAHAPIVIQLKDTLRSTVQQGRRNLDTDSDLSVRSSGDVLIQETFGDVSTIPMFIPKCLHQPQMQYNRHNFTSAGCILRKHCQTSENLTALISVLEKAHHKNSSHIESNLIDQSSDHSKLSHLLNNAVSFLEKGYIRQRSIVDCDNVDVICNDLHNNEKSTEAVDDTDSASDKSSVISSSEALSDSDSQVVEESQGFEFSVDELQRFTEYATGYPIYRLDSDPVHCPECMSWVSQHVYRQDGGTWQTTAAQGTIMDGEGRPRKSDHNGSEEETALEGPDNEGKHEDKEGESCVDSRKAKVGSVRPVSWSPSYTHPDSVLSSPTGRSDAPLGGQIRDRQLWDIGICQTSRRSGRNLPDIPCPNNVFLDLTGTDVSVSVYYHHSLLQDEKTRKAVAASLLSFGESITTGSSFSSVLSLEDDTTMGPSLSPGHCSFHLGSPLFTLPIPLSFFNDNSLPKIAMVPPLELRQFEMSRLPPRQWIQVDTCAEETDPFTLMTYNVLFDGYCTHERYRHCPEWARNWDYRKKCILQEILDHEPTILTLQEVGNEHYFDFFLPRLKDYGYDGIFSPKKRTVCWTEEIKPDGCAIFYKKSRFQKLETKVMLFGKMATFLPNANDTFALSNRVVPKENIGLCALLEFKTNHMKVKNNTPTDKLLVATTHLCWRPEESDVKMVQTFLLMWELEKFWKEVSVKYDMPSNCNSIPLVIGADLNSLPDSGVIEFLSTGRVPINHSEFLYHVYHPVFQNMYTDDQTHICHNFSLSECYGNIMPFTNYTEIFREIIDYIFYSNGHLKVKSLLGPYDANRFQQNRVLCCPTPHIPSDHFPLVVEFELEKNEGP